MPQRRPIPANAGFSLVELLVVAMLMSFILMAVMSLVIPVQRSTVMQTRVTDVQDNLRLAMNRMTHDLLTAGFLIEDPTATPAVFNFGPQGFTIRTVLIGDGFARVDLADNVSGDVEVTLSNPQMAAAFEGHGNPDLASKVRLFDPVAALELGAGGAYNVKSSSAVTGKLLIDTPLTAGANPEDVRRDVVVVRVVTKGDPSTLPPPVQTIRYEFRPDDSTPAPDDGMLMRIVNGGTAVEHQQILAREISSVAFTYNNPATTADDTPVKRINIQLTGQAQAIKEGDAVSGAKTRQLTSTVSLRNV